MSTARNLEVAEAAHTGVPSSVTSASEKVLEKVVSSEKALEFMGPNGEEYPTEEEVETLRRVVGYIPWIIYTIAFVELCERFAYYGTTAVFVNFIQQPLPPAGPFPSAGAGGTDEQSGALDLGQRASTALTLFNSFWSYVTPMVGGYLADAHWGRYKTINVAILIATVGHIIIIIASIPKVIENPDGSIATFVIGLILFGIGVGFFKCNISPLIAEQYEHNNPRQTIKVLASGERVIVDPTMTVSRIYMRYYQMINVGALVGQIGMVYAEKYVGFWLSFLLPTIMFLFCPFVMIICRKRYVRIKPTGSVLSKSMKLYGLAMKGRWSLNPATTLQNLRDPNLWEAVKPSNMANKPTWMTFDDAWVDEVRRGFKACSVFLWYPIYWLSYSQMLNNLVSQAASMKLDGVPNDIVNNLDPFALIIFIPIFDNFVYPTIARMGYNFTPLKKITAGFICGTLSMAVAAIIQHFIYEKSPCGKYAGDCDEPPPISVWVQTPAYILIAFSEIFASITGLEYAFTKAPKNMRSLITGAFWFTHAFSSAVAQGFVSLSEDPLLVWLYTIVAIISFFGGIGFWWAFRELDGQEDELNALPQSTFGGTERNRLDEEAVHPEQDTKLG